MLYPVGLRCLIVDDNLQFLEAATDLLQRDGVTVVGVASNIAEAVRKAGELLPDVTLVDIDLHGESGFDLALRLAGAPAVQRSRVVLTSTYSELDFADLIAASPAVGFLAKADLSGSTLRDALDGGDRD